MQGKRREDGGVVAPIFYSACCGTRPQLLPVLPSPGRFRRNLIRFRVKSLPLQIL
jgi:hypothetical protein